MSPKNFYLLNAFVSILTMSFLFFIIYGPKAHPSPIESSFLPSLNASFNGLSLICLILAIVFIKNSNKKAHVIFVILALVFSAGFLVSYIIHHTIHGDTPFQGQGWIRPVYFFILISHIVLSMVAFPMILTTIFCSLKKQWQQHKNIAKYTYPIWMYVCATGVIVFLFLKYLSN